MKLYVEALVVIAPLFLVAAWLLFDNLHRKYKLWRYKPENDKGKRGEEYRQQLIRASATTSGREVRSFGSSQPKGQSLFQAADAELERERSFSYGTPSNSDGKVSRKFFNPFTRRT